MAEIDGWGLAESQTIEKQRVRGDKRTTKTTSGLGPPSWKMAEIDRRGLAESQTIEKSRVRREKRATETTSGLGPPSWKMAEIDCASLGHSKSVEQLHGWVSIMAITRLDVTRYRRVMLAQSFSTNCRRGGP